MMRPLRLDIRIELGDRTIIGFLSALSGVIDHTLDRALGPRPQPSALLTLRFQDGQSITGGIMALKLGDANRVDGTLQPIDVKNNPVPLDQVENPEFSSSNVLVLTVESPSPDTPDNPFSFRASAVGPIGTAQIQYKYDNLTGEGGDIIQGTADVEVIPGRAVGAGIQFSEQVPQ